MSPLAQQKPLPITDQQKDGRKYIVFDREYDPVEWVVARYTKAGQFGNWMTWQSSTKMINPSHYVEIEM